MTMTPTASGRTAAREPSILPTLLLRWETLLMVLLLLGAVGNAYLSENFLDVTNLFNMTVDFMEKSIIALPMALIIVSGNIDLSVASTLALSAIVMGVLFQAGWNVWLASLAGLAVGALAGLANGLLVTRVRLPSLVVTLGTYALYRGLASAIVGDEALSGFPDDFTTIGQGYLPGTPVPVPLAIFLVLVVPFALLLHRTSFGRLVYAIGSNEEACRFAGVAVDRIKVILFVLAGLMSALAGLMLNARFGATRADVGAGFELDVITAVVLGGVDIFGGQGTILGVVLALFLIGELRFGMSLNNVPAQVQTIAIGLLLILAIILPRLLRARSGGRRVASA